ncbi:unnamed protein product [Polarella glacialis]|uniref:J domain-containing protein n=1 Tax=Polarella glacialis TaxID=89957 RepID=A0A813HDQ5_POLGL|nr:unnamed protein product [Polarella glacialis]
MASIAQGDDDPFVVLGVSSGASQQAVESAFRRKALRCHPDRNPKDSLAKSKFLRLSKAKEVLLSASSRKAAEARRARNKASTAGAKQPSAKPKAAAGTVPRAPSDAQRREEERRSAARAAAEERLRQSEAEAERQKHRRAGAEAKAQRHRKAERVEEEQRERVAASQRRRADIFEAWRQQKKRKQDVAEPKASPDRKAASSECPPVGPRGDAPPERSTRRVVQSAPSGIFRPATPVLPGGCSLDHRQRTALQRLQVRRQGGEGPSGVPTRVGSWWVQDDEVELYHRRMELYGYA